MPCKRGGIAGAADHIFPSLSRGVYVKYIMPKQRSLKDILNELSKKSSGEKTSVGEIVTAFERKGFGPLLLVPALFLVLPTGAIPGAPILCSIIIILITVQIIFGKKHPWIPKRLKSIHFTNEKLNKGIDFIEPYVKWIDKHTNQRYKWLINPIFERIVAVICLVLGVAIIPLGIIPFAVLLPGLAIGFFALGLAVNDGLLVALGLTVTVATGVSAFYI